METCCSFGANPTTVKNSLPPGHVIHTLYSEHEKILGFLDELEAVDRKVQTSTSYDSAKEEIRKLLHIAEHLIGAEPHHQREEEVLFPEMERLGIEGPPQVMRQEHVELRKMKHEVKDIAAEFGRGEFRALQRKLNGAAGNLIQSLREHIAKENNVLFPMALGVIRSVEKWKEMKESCDRIGYCCFSPKA